jgi:hypothetical protein
MTVTSTRLKCSQVLAVNHSLGPQKAETLQSVKGPKLTEQYSTEYFKSFPKARSPFMQGNLNLEQFDWRLLILVAESE